MYNAAVIILSTHPTGKAIFLAVAIVLTSMLLAAALAEGAIWLGGRSSRKRLEKLQHGTAAWLKAKG